MKVHETRLEGDHGFDGGEVGERVVGDGEVSHGRHELGESFQGVGVDKFVVFVGDGYDLRWQEQRRRLAREGREEEGRKAQTNRWFELSDELPEDLGHS